MGVERKSEIMAISNKYNNTLDNLIDSSDTEFPDQLESLNWPRLTEKKTRNTPRSKNASPRLLEEDCLDEDVLVTALERAPKT